MKIKHFYGILTLEVSQYFVWSPRVILNDLIRSSKVYNDNREAWNKTYLYS